jgi:putative transposase
VKARCGKLNLSEIKSITISRSSNGKYWVSVNVQENVSPMPKTNSEIGLDLGIKDLLVDNRGNKTINPRWLEQELDVIKQIDRQLSKKKKGSNNFNKLILKRAKIFSQITNRKNDFMHKLSNQIVKNHDIICMEDLKISELIQKSNTSLSRAISDASWNSLVSKIAYKSTWYGKTFQQVGTYFASTKTCSHCKAVDHTLTLEDRTWTCTGCKATHDRDTNAAKNILNEGKRLILSAKPKPVKKKPTLSERYKEINKKKNELKKQI